jgi:V/A-type H+-transporting ATPase subunit C
VAVGQAHLNEYLNARVSLMATRLLRENEPRVLAEGSLEERARVLERAGLSQLVADLQAGRYLEQSIIRAQLADILVLMRAAGEARSFLQYWTLRFEITNLKAVIRGKLSKAPSALIRQELSDMGFLASLPTEELLQTEDIGELLRRLETTPYADMVRFARRAFEAQPRLFDLDAALDRRYYHGLAERARPLEEALGASFRKIMELHLDRVNLTWLLRFRFSYHLPPAQVYFLLIPSHYRLNSSVLKGLSVLDRMDEVLAALPLPYRNWLQDTGDVNQVASVLDSRFAEGTRLVLHSAAPAFARAFAYLLLRDRDLRRVRAALKGWSLGLDPQTISQALGLLEMPATLAEGAA